MIKQRAELERFHRLVGQCAFIFKQAPGLVFQELHNRLAGGQSVPEGIAQRLAQARLRYAQPWLRCRTGEVDIPELLHVLSGHPTAVLDCAFSADGSRLASAGSDGTLRLWSTKTGEPTLSFRLPGLMFWRCAFSPDGVSIAALAGSDRDEARGLMLLDTRSGDMREVTGAAVQTLDVCPFDPTGAALVAPGANGTMRLIEAPSGAIIKTLSGHQGRVLACAFSRDGARLVSVATDGRLIVWDVKEGRQERSAACLSRSATTAAFSPGLDLLAVALTHGMLALFEVGGGRPRGLIKLDGDRVAGCRFSRDGSLIVAHGFEGNTEIWAVDTRRRIAAVQAFSGLRPGSLNADGDRLVTAGCPPDYSAYLWNTRDGSQTAQLTAHTFEMEACAFSPNGRTVATAACDGTLMLWDVKTAESRIPGTRPHASGIQVARFGPAGRVVAFASTLITLLDGETGGEVVRLTGHARRTAGLSFSPDGTRLASTGMEERAPEAALRLWDLATGKIIWSRTVSSWVEAYRSARPVDTSSGSRTTGPWSSWRRPGAGTGCAWRCVSRAGARRSSIPTGGSRFSIRASGLLSSGTWTGATSTPSWRTLNRRRRGRSAPTDFSWLSPTNRCCPCTI